MGLILSIYNTDLRPATDNAFDLGTLNNQFKDLFLNGTAYLDALTMEGDITLSTHNIITDTTTGTKIGTAIDQKLGFFNATPIIQPIATTDIKDVLVNLGLLANSGITPLNLDGGLLTAGDILVTSLAATSGITNYSVVLADVNGNLKRDSDITFMTDTLYVAKLDISTNPFKPKIYSQETEPDIGNSTCAFWHDSTSGVDKMYLLIDYNGTQKKVELTA